MSRAYTEAEETGSYVPGPMLGLVISDIIIHCSKPVWTRGGTIRAATTTSLYFL